MISKTIQIQEITVDELANKVAEKLLCKIELYLKEYATKDDEIFLSRTETAKFLKVDLSTIHNWTKRGKLIAYGFGAKVYYKKIELLDTLENNRLHPR
ncbi:helix-turn-helix domain-containing protein [Lutibacter sp. B1]|jgi:hypothetical protein|uniref:helix-turn-helix domain-containing protein n=1 Tax=Lutibacter sp. B1 TaxID=2725996 RepID=UPI0014565059|nr:helix-turn-helix domain-containing protein [Lutibacter sp. B1]NLP58566.1 helix-turn-helix domain-containing protein [Lutibacter sp. B1]